MDRQSTNLQDAVVLVTSANAEDTGFSTGFVVHQDGQASYVLTCAHILDDLGAEALQVAHTPATVEARGTADGVDLAVLRVEGLLTRSPLRLSSSGAQGQNIIIPGFQLYGTGRYLLRPLNGALGSIVGLETRQGNVRVKAWDLKIADEYLLQPGYSGSPVIDEASQQVVGIVSTRQGEGRKGVAIAAEMLAHIWHIPSAIMAPESSSTNSDIKSDSTISGRPTTEQKVVEPSTIREVDMSNNTAMRRAVILTALSDEYKAVRAHLQNLKEEVHPHDTIYERGIFPAPGQSWDVGIVMVGAGDIGAAMETERAINYFNPSIVLFVGVAGGLKDVVIGDVVCATKVYGYESGKDTEEGFQTRPDVGSSAYGLIQRARREEVTGDWLKRLGSSSTSEPKVYVAPIAAGEKVVSSTLSSTYTFLRKHYGDAVAVEMEGRGFLQAAFANHSVQAMVIRGISDLIDDKKQNTDKTTQPLAARNASAFAFEILAKLPNDSQGTQPQQPVTSQPAQVVTKAEGSGGNVTVSPSSSKENVEIFYSYVSEDQSYVNRLDRHLAVLKRRGWITTSYAAEVGADRMELLNQADIILLLISPDFIGTDDIYEKEAKRAMERRKEGVRVIPVLLLPTDGWRLEEFGGLQSVPRDKPVSKYSDRDDAFSQIAQDIRAIVTNIRKERGLPVS